MKDSRQLSPALKWDVETHGWRDKQMTGDRRTDEEETREKRQIRQIRTDYAENQEEKNRPIRDRQRH